MDIPPPPPPPLTVILRRIARASMPPTPKMQMRNVRAVSFRSSVLLVSAPADGQSRADSPRRAAPAAAATLSALRFLGVRAAAIGDAPALRATGLAPALETILPDNAPPDALASALGLAPADILHTGPDLSADINAALAAGMRAAWLAPAATFHPRGAAIHLRHLADLPDILRLADTASHHHAPRALVSDLIALLRDVPPEHHSAVPAAPIGVLVHEITANLRTEAAPIETLRARWHELVPQVTLNASSAPERVTPGGALVIHCQNTIVREELHRWHSRRLLPLIRHLPGCSSIQKITFHI